MSRITFHKVQCPCCSNEQKNDVYESINVTLNPELKQKFLNADINIFICEKCREKSFINAPILYHDMEKRFCVQYYPSESLNDDGFFTQFTSDGRIILEGIPQTLAESNEYLTTPHIVFDMIDMIRYVAFRDRLHEMIKSE